MWTAGRAVITGIDLEEIVVALDSCYCHQMVVLHFCYAVENRLAGQALFVLRDDLLEVATESLAAARKLAARIGELGGAVTADPTQFVQRSPLRAFSLPESASDVGSILRHVRAQIRTGIEAYGALLAQVREKDDLSYALILELLRRQVAREAEVEAALI
jgi:ferritin-like protein